MNRRYGFTLIELLVVISLFGMFASIVLGSIRSSRIKALDANVRVTVNELRTAATSYYQDHNEYPPHSGSARWDGWGLGCTGRSAFGRPLYG